MKRSSQCYSAFIESKSLLPQLAGLKPPFDMPSQLFPFQKDIVSWALERGSACIFADCGVGKTAMQLAWAKNIPGRKLIVAPLAVGRQTVCEGNKFGISCTYSREDLGHVITVTNYEMLHNFDPADFSGIVLDESSILKSYTGVTRNQIIGDWSAVDFRLAATATPAPNDLMELGNHAEYMGVMTRTEMLSKFFVHDGGETQKWRLKGHAQDDFWKWLSSWAAVIRRPSDLGYDDDGFCLPDLNVLQVEVESKAWDQSHLFPMLAASLSERQEARRSSVRERCGVVATMVNGSSDPWIVWCDLNSESELLTQLIPDALEVKGSDSYTDKEKRLVAFSEGRARVLITKPSIAGYGMNWQHCYNVAFTGLSDSFEQYYQAVRRCWRYGQKKDVNVYIVTSAAEGAVVANIKRKEREWNTMTAEVVSHTRRLNQLIIHDHKRARKNGYKAAQAIKLPSFI